MVEFLRKALRGLMAKHDRRYRRAGAGPLSARDQLNRSSMRTGGASGRRRSSRFCCRSLRWCGSVLAINFKTMLYELSWLYEGGFRFKKHYFGPKPGEMLKRRRRAKCGGIQCAQFLDDLRSGTLGPQFVGQEHFLPAPDVERLVLSRLACQLKDGRSLVVEQGRASGRGHRCRRKAHARQTVESRSGGRHDRDAGGGRFC